jgi:hypothetical protein
MRFISIHKATPDMEAGLPPSPEVLAGMGPLIEEMASNGVFIGGEGLRPSSLGVRLHFSNGKRVSVTRGPLKGTNELTSAFSIVRAKTIDEAIDWATRFASTSGEADIDVRPVTEPWHLGFAPEPPPGESVRFMIIQKADKDSESGNRLVTGEILEKLDRAGVLVAAEALRPSSEGRRLTFRGGKRHVLDGPFAESKELIAGYAILETPSLDEAIRWAAPFAALLGDIEIDVRPLYDPAEPRS